MFSFDVGVAPGQSGYSSCLALNANETTGGEPGCVPGGYT